MEKYNREREYDVLDFIATVMLHWRGMIVAAVVGGIVLGALGYAKDYISNAEKKSVYEQLEGSTDEEKQQAYLESGLTTTQIENVRTVLAFERSIKEREDYLNDSEYINLNPTNYANGVLSYLVVADGTDEESVQIKENKIRMVYKSLIMSEMFMGRMEKVAGFEDVDLSELMTVADPSSSMFGCSVLEVRVKFNDEKSCRMILDELSDYIESNIEDIKTKSFDHELKLITKSVDMVSGEEIANDRRLILSDIAAYRNSATTVRKLFTQKENAYYEFMRAVSGPVMDEDVITPMEYSTEELSASINKKFVLLGILGFAVLYALFWAAVYIFDVRIKICDNLGKLYPVKEFTKVYSKSSGKVFAKIDNLINSIRTIGRRCFYDDDAVALVAASISAEVRKHGYSELAIVGCNMKGRSMEICEKIKSQIPESLGNVTIYDNAIYRSDLREKFDEVSAVFLVEKAGVTLYSEIDHELEFFERLSIPVVGISVIE